MIQFRATGTEAERLLLVGMTGSGKTSLARVLVAQASEVLWIDPKGMNDPGYPVERASRFLELPGGRARRDLLGQLLAQHGGRVTVQLANMPGVKDADQLDAAAEAAYLRGNMLVVYDDVGGVLTSAPSYFVNRILTMGRGRGVGFMPMAQRVFNIPRVLLTEASHVVCFAFDDEDGRQRIAREVSAELARESVALTFGDHRFCWYEKRTRQLVKFDALPRAALRSA